MLRRTVQLLLGLFYEVLRRLLCREQQLLFAINEISQEYIVYDGATHALARRNTHTHVWPIYGVLTAVNVEITFPNIKPRSLTEIYRSFGGTHYPNFYGIWRRQDPSKHRQTSTRLYDVISKTTVLTSGPSFPKGTHFIKPVGLSNVSSFSYWLL